jgi:hypothetical protein
MHISVNKNPAIWRDFTFEAATTSVAAGPYMNGHFCNARSDGPDGDNAGNGDDNTRNVVPPQQPAEAGALPIPDDACAGVRTPDGRQVHERLHPG